jgi:hypothetical protein
VKPILFNPQTETPAKAVLQKGAVLRLPNGVDVRSTHPTRKSYTLQRAQVVQVHGTISGRYVSMCEALEEYRVVFDTRGVDMSQLEIWQNENAIEYSTLMVELDEPAVRWAGTGGYWCEVPLSVALRHSDQTSCTEN